MNFHVKLFPFISARNPYEHISPIPFQAANVANTVTVFDTEPNKEIGILA
jgi:hypothetical protein